MHKTVNSLSETKTNPMFKNNWSLGFFILKYVVVHVLCISIMVNIFLDALVPTFIGFTAFENIYQWFVGVVYFTFLMVVVPFVIFFVCGGFKLRKKMKAWDAERRELASQQDALPAE